MIRRRVFHKAALGALASMMMGRANADAYPTRPLRLVVGFPPGGPNDTLARLIAGWLASRLGQPVTVENRPGNAGNIATSAVVRAAPDGHTLLLTGPANAISGSTPDKLDFVFLRDIAPVGGITREPLVLLVHPSVPAKMAAELIAHAKANPGKVRLAATGTWSSPHVTAELFRMLTGISVELVQYGGGGPALKALAAGDAQMMFEPMSAAIGLVRGGKLRALAVSSAARSPVLPQVPTLEEAGLAGFEATAWWALFAPAGVPLPIAVRLTAETRRIVELPAFRDRLRDIGVQTPSGTPVPFAEFQRAETAKWGRAVRDANVTLD
jgi:tripartite-type tricarboxylate transporter receptor subunit TctC